MKKIIQRKWGERKNQERKKEGNTVFIRNKVTGYGEIWGRKRKLGIYQKGKRERRERERGGGRRRKIRNIQKVTR